MMVLQLEQSVANARSKFDEVIDEAAAFAFKHKDSEHSEDELKALQKKKKAKREQYFNTMDRLCSCIIKGYIDEDEYRVDYRKTINKLIDEYTECFGVDTKHPNIKKIYEFWSEDKSVRDIVPGMR